MIVGERGREVTLVPRSLPQREPRGGSHCGTGLGRACGGGPTRLWAGSCMAAASATTDIMRCARAVVATANSAPRRPRRGRRRETTVDAPRARGEVQLETRARLSGDRSVDSRVPGPGTSIHVDRVAWGRRFYLLTRKLAGKQGQGPSGPSGTGSGALRLGLPAAGPGGRCAAARCCAVRGVPCACGERDVTAHISLTFRSGALDMVPRCTHTHMLSRHNRWDPDRTR